MSTALRRAASVTVVLALLVLMAVALAAAAVISAPVCLPARGRWRAVRLLSFGVTYLALDAGAAAGAARIWLACRRVRPAAARDRQREQLTIALADRALARMYRAGRRAFRLRVEIAADQAALADARPGGIGGPVIVLCRHGGPGDTLLLVHGLLRYARRRPAIVLKHMLIADPWIDILIGRMPHAYIRRREGTDQSRLVGELAAQLGPQDALALFPEGGNFTPARQQRRIARLRAVGQRIRAARAARMHYVLAPHPAGTLAALAAAPGADVVVVAHAGLGHMYSLATIWRGIPLDRPLRATWWRVPAAEIPPGAEARTRWLFDQWAAVDDWITAQASLVPGASREQRPAGPGWLTSG